MTARSLACQLLIRLALVGGLLTVAGVSSYSATHWEPVMEKSQAPTTVAAR